MESSDGLAGGGQGVQDRADKERSCLPSHHLWIRRGKDLQKTDLQRLHHSHADRGHQEPYEVNIYFSLVCMFFCC